MERELLTYGLYPVDPWGCVTNLSSIHICRLHLFLELPVPAHCSTSHSLQWQPLFFAFFLSGVQKVAGLNWFWQEAMIVDARRLSSSGTQKWFLDVKSMPWSFASPAASVALLGFSLSLKHCWFVVYRWVSVADLRLGGDMTAWCLHFSIISLLKK